MMPSLQRLREYVEAANVARQRAHSERTVQGKQILQEIERCFRRLVEIERWAADQQQYNRPFAHFGLFNGHAGRSFLREDIMSRSVDQECRTSGAHQEGDEKWLQGKERPQDKEPLELSMIAGKPYR